MARQVKTDVLVVDQFPVFEDDGYTKKSGETLFTPRIWLDGSPQAVPVSISEIGVSGEYKVEFTPNANGFWRVTVLIDYNKDIWGGEYEASTGSVEDLYNMVRRLLGLSHENIFIDETLYDGDTQLISARVRLFDTKANCDAATDGGSETTGLIATYTLTSSWEGINEFKVFKQVIEP
jgi:hypothetical protein